MTTSFDEHRLKRDRVEGLLTERGADSLTLTSPGALSWLLAGARVQVSLVGDPVVAAVLRRGGDDEIRVFGNERARIEAEELPHGLTVTSPRWDQPLLAEPTRASPAALREADVAFELQDLRASLLDVEIDRYRLLCQEVTAMLGAALESARPDHTERSLAARLAGGIVALGADPLVVLVAGRERLGFPHPLPTESPLGDLAMAVVCARRGGLIANVTRWIRFRPATNEEGDAQARLLAVEADFFAATKPGALLSDVFAASTAAYAAHGLAPDTWERHHQGGPTGYNGRDPRATATTSNIVRADQAFAWNPNAPGVKLEDTVIVRADGAVDVLSVDPGWPSAEVHGLTRPAIREQ
ncbi:M24 family metallopeptidase [Frondihabitans cladoniiphilus]|uniref:M24 family metallopeptidase n=1 Tax=Frondihabitans cladoniiphilus TaxID=715785 RepID=A0ABP8W9C4_9MICO